LNSAKVSSGIRRILLAAIVAVPVSTAAGQRTVEGRVVGVTDGDTITILDAGRAQHVVRLGGIDAPERAQPFGRAARENLSRLVFDKRVEARCWKVDQFRREICSVFVGQRDVGLAMVQEGYAWHFKRFADEQSPQEREAYSTAQESAAAARRGLWQDEDPVPPWDWRRKRGR
jgi:endonuclease YncB( thermonuclease family)